MAYFIGDNAGIIPGIHYDNGETYLIPVQLRLKNFMCYRDNVAPLNFNSLHVACLCGDNGSGKSSIFDAMT